MKKTPIVLALSIGALLLYDMIALILWGAGETVSVVMLEFSKSYPIIPFLAGVACGHLFWPQVPDENK